MRLCSGSDMTSGRRFTRQSARTGVRREVAEVKKAGTGLSMTQLLNLLAREAFKKDQGCATDHFMKKLMGSRVPLGAVLVTALEDVEAWTNGLFKETTPLGVQ